jgi:REP element-mobilizing transposase RayT
MARGNRRESIFHDDDGRRFFLSTLSEACAMTGWRVHTWVLMGNHHYLFFETAEPNRVAGMSWWPKTSRCVAGVNVSQQLRRFDGAQANTKLPPKKREFLKGRGKRKAERVILL